MSVSSGSGVIVPGMPDYTAGIAKLDVEKIREDFASFAAGALSSPQVVAL